MARRRLGRGCEILLVDAGFEMRVSFCVSVFIDQVLDVQLRPLQATIQKPLYNLALTATAPLLTISSISFSE